MIFLLTSPSDMIRTLDCRYTAIRNACSYMCGIVQHGAYGRSGVPMDFASGLYTVEVNVNADN